VTFRLVTWNLQGSNGLDVEAVAEVLRSRKPSAIVLQEVTRGQATRIGKALAAASVTWTFKHGTPAQAFEGMATIGVSAPLHVKSRAITFPLRLWSWRRRIVQQFDIDVDGTSITVVHAHLSPHASGRELRLREADKLVRPDPSTMIVAGDLNETPEGATLRRLRTAGLHDAWADAPVTDGPGPTNWSGRQDGPADARIDYVLYGLRLRVERASVPHTTGEEQAMWAGLSDHLPLTVDLSPAA
jgi:endonuclease/exonuclease/phosphatase family metal-dependent hydrolase